MGIVAKEVANISLLAARAPTSLLILVNTIEELG